MWSHEFSISALIFVNLQDRLCLHIAYSHCAITLYIARCTSIHGSYKCWIFHKFFVRIQLVGFFFIQFFEFNKWLKKYFSRRKMNFFWHNFAEYGRWFRARWKYGCERWTILFEPWYMQAKMFLWFTEGGPFFGCEQKPLFNTLNTDQNKKIMRTTWF